jgi:ferredoxin
MPGRIAKISVDRNACIGSAICAFVAPGVFELDDEGVSTVVNAGGDRPQERAPDAKILEAAEGCPVMAIHLEDENGDPIFPREEDRA